MSAAREQRRQNHQVPRREQPLLGLVPRWLGSSHDEAQAMAACKIVKMLGANPRKVGDLWVGENFLARFDCYHSSILEIISHRQG